MIDLEATHTAGVYPKRPLAIVRGAGAHLWDDAGRRYIDCVGGQGAANLGHAHPAIVAVLAAQAERLISCPEIFYNDRRSELLSQLANVAPDGLNRAFLCNSGSEAVETAIKFARLSTGRSSIVAATRGFHGRTMGALSATWRREYREPFEPLVPGFRHAPFAGGMPDAAEASADAIGREAALAALDRAIDTDTAAVILEIVQGEGGVHPIDPAYLGLAVDLCRKRGALLILDEVQTGFGRTGRLFACEHYGVVPDLMALAKSMAGGVPMGACLIGPRVGRLPAMSHGSTFGGNPLACAAALATLDVLAADYPEPGSGENLIARAARLGRHLRERIEHLGSPLVREVRGLGLMVGVDLKLKVTPVLQQLQELGVLALPAGATVLRLLPPLVIEEEDLDQVVDAIGRALDHVTAQRARMTEDPCH